MLYDAHSRRVQKQVHTWNAGTSSYQLSATLRFLYDGWNLITELTASNQVVRSYAWGLDLSGTLQGAGGVGGLLVITDAAAGTQSLPSYDGNGNVLALINAADGTLAAQYEYGPFGEPLRATGPMARGNPFRFSTKYQDQETGLLYYGYRYYQPAAGRWSGRDPIGDVEFVTRNVTTLAPIMALDEVAQNFRISVYAFCSNSSLDCFDVLGLLDQRTEEHLRRLDPRLSFVARIHITLTNQATKPWEARIVQSHRTYAEQDELYAKGRTKPGAKVTNARGGQSNHNFRLAYDIAFFCGTAVKWEGPEFDTAGSIGEGLGLVWGGRWKSPVDRPHFEYPHGLTLQELRDAWGSSGQTQAPIPPNPKATDLQQSMADFVDYILHGG
jgi:RHS repeat-associated protein